tara:strand:- start:1487 stop:2464 length:978 start_codon:yes stop_codon:yes gene_type:complete
MRQLLQITDLKIYYKARRGLLGSTDIKAVDGVSIDIDRGQTISIVGESGSGKTTLGKAILKLLPLTGGEITLDGENINLITSKDIKKFRLKVQGVFQDPYSSLNSYMNVGQILREPLGVHGVGDKSEQDYLVEQALENVKLTHQEDLQSKYPHMLSGGQRQRIGLARALILKPALIVADEPVSMIDASSRSEILYLMRDIQQKLGTTFILITHDIATAKHFSDKIAVMYAGKIVEYGDPAQILDNPLHPYTKALIRSIPNPDPKNRLTAREIIPGEPPSASSPPLGCKFHPRCPLFIDSVCDLIEPRNIWADENHQVSCHLIDAS